MGLFLLVVGLTRPDRRISHREEAFFAFKRPMIVLGVLTLASDPKRAGKAILQAFYIALMPFLNRGRKYALKRRKPLTAKPAASSKNVPLKQQVVLGQVWSRPSTAFDYNYK